MTVEKGHTMITAIRPYAPQSKQRQNFGISQKPWEDMLVSNPGVINNKFNDAMVHGDISLQDAIDTLTAAKKRLAQGFHEAFDDEITWAQREKEIRAGAKK